MNEPIVFQDIASYRVLVVHHIAFHGLEPLSRQKSASQEDFYNNTFAGLYLASHLHARHLWPTHLWPSLQWSKRPRSKSSGWLKHLPTSIHCWKNNDTRNKVSYPCRQDSSVHCLKFILHGHVLMVHVVERLYSMTVVLHCLQLTSHPMYLLHLREGVWPLSTPSQDTPPNILYKAFPQIYDSSPPESTWRSCTLRHRSSTSGLRNRFILLTSYSWGSCSLSRPWKIQQPCRVGHSRLKLLTFVLSYTTICFDMFRITSQCFTRV